MTETYELLGNPRFPEVLRLVLEVAATEIRVAMPGRVTEYDDQTHLATVQPLIKAKTRTEADFQDLAPIQRVPVMHPRTAAAAILLPVAAGDPVTILFSDRALGRWKAGDAVNPVIPEAARMHDLSDCWAIPGGYPTGKPLAPSNPGALDIVLEPGTKVAVGNGTDELVQLLHDLMDYVETKITFSNGGGPTGPPTNAAALLAPIREQLENLKV